MNDLCEPYGFTPLISQYTDNIGTFIMNLVFGNSVLLGDQLLQANFPDTVKCFPLEGTISGRIIAWDSTRDNKIIQDFVKICTEPRG